MLSVALTIVSVEYTRQGIRGTPHSLLVMDFLDELQGRRTLSTSVMSCSEPTGHACHHKDELPKSATNCDRALCNASQAKGELRVAHAEIDQLKAEKAALEQALDAKGKEVRLQVLQVSLQYRADGGHKVYTYVKDEGYHSFPRIRR